MSKQSSAHEPSTVPQSSYQKYQEEVRPEQIQKFENQPYKPQQHEPLTNPPPQPGYQQSPYQSQSYQRRTTKFQQQPQNVQITISDECVQQINKLINEIIESDYECHAIAYYFDRADIGLYGVADFFRNCGLVKCRKARLLMDYLMVRGAQVVLDDIEKPNKTEWDSPVQAFEYFLQVQRNIYDESLKVYQTGQKINDAHLTDFLEESVLRPLSMWIRRIGVLISNAEKAGPTLGVYQLNKHLCYNMKIFFETDKEITDFLDQ